MNFLLILYLGWKIILRSILSILSAEKSVQFFPSRNIFFTKYIFYLFKYLIDWSIDSLVLVAYQHF